MTTKPDWTQRADASYEAELASRAYARAARAAAAEVAIGGGGDALIVLPVTCPTIPGEQDDDGVRAAAAIDILRHLVASYEEEA